MVPGLLEPTAVVPLPALLRETLRTLVEEIRDLEDRLKQVDRQLHAIADADPVATRLQTVPGVGVLVATAMVGSVPHIHAFRRGRHFASWLGLTPREASSGLRGWQGGISKRGDVYLRTLLIHGARSVLRRTRACPDPAQGWLAQLVHRRNPNVAAVALANKNARIVWALLAHGREYQPGYVGARLPTAA
jgi:transposase